MKARVIGGLMAIAAICATAPADSIAQLRGAGGEIRIAALDLDGVTPADAVQGGPISLGRIRAVAGDLAPAFETVRATAELVWRAESRLARGDVVAAEPLFEQLAEQYRGRAGVTASSVARGLLACRLARGAHTDAVTAWLRWLAAGGQAAPTLNAVEPRLSGALVGDLPPIWLDLPAVRAWVTSERPGDEVLAAFEKGRAAVSRLPLHQQLHAVYWLAAASETGQTRGVPELRPDNAPDLVAAKVFMAQTSNASVRALAREQLLEMMNTTAETPWVEAWVRVAVGRSLLREADPLEQKRGILQLLRLAARPVQANPRADQYLTAVALAEAAMALARTGDDRAARVLAVELEQRFPRSVALGLAPVQALLRADETRNPEQPTGHADGQGTSAGEMVPITPLTAESPSSSDDQSVPPEQREPASEPEQRPPPPDPGAPGGPRPGEPSPAPPTVIPILPPIPLSPAPGKDSTP